MYKNSNKYTDKDADRIYFNIVMPYKPIGGNSIASYRQELSEPLLMNPSDYYLAITRFTIPTQDIPILIPEIQPFPNVNLNNTIYSVTLTYAAETSGQTFIQFITTNPNEFQSLPLTVTHPNADKTPYYYIYEYTDFLDQINTALASALVVLKTKPGTAPIALAPAPYFIYNPVTLRISLIANSDFYDLAGVPPIPIKIYINNYLYAFLDAMPTFFYGKNLPGGLDVQFNVHKLNNNWYPSPFPQAGQLLLEMSQQYNVLADWNSFKSLRLITNLLPVFQEYTPQVGNASEVNVVGVLKDFEPLIEFGPDARTVVQYQLDSPYQLINLISNIPLTKIDIQIFWSDQFGNQFPLFIPYGQIVTIKLVFIKKSTFTS